jgi:hypothetical protein
MTQSYNHDPQASEDSLSRRLLFRNQFILGPGYAEPRCFAHWKRLKLHSSAYLTVHPELNVSSFQKDGKSVTLLGYIIDPGHPGDTDLDILKRLMDTFSDSVSVRQHTYGMGGRWILILDNGRSLKLFNDAAGLRQVFFTRDFEAGGVWCATQPAVLAGLLHRRITTQAEDYINSYEFRHNPEFRWPGDGSPFEEIHHLLPNHWLDLTTGEVRRYFPDGVLEELSLDTAVDRIGGQLRAILIAAAHRFKLAVSLTAGLDSRMILSAARPIKNEIAVMTVRQIDKPDDHMDVTVAARLLAENGLQHDLVSSSLILEDKFHTIFHSNAKPAHYIYLPDAFAIYQRYRLGRVAVTGSVSEIGRLSFRNQLGKPETQKISAHDLARLQKMGRHPYAIRSFERWLGSQRKATGIPLLDLFEWEQGHGNWLAMCQSEFDIAWKEILSPFNSRQILTSMLSVPAVYRRGPADKLFLRIIENLWPELLEVPINPGEKVKRRPIQKIKSAVPYPVKEYIKNILKKDHGRSDFEDP